MTAVDDFLEAIGSQRAERLLRNLDGTIRFDLRRDGDVESVLVTIDDGGVSASRRRRRADCVATMDEALFRSIARGDANAFAAALRGEIEIEGNAALVLAFQRLFPGPPAASPSAPRAGAGTTR